MVLIVSRCAVTPAPTIPRTIYAHVARAKIMEIISPAHRIAMLAIFSGSFMPCPVR